jgi:biopolymer transport protein ExbD
MAGSSGGHHSSGGPKKARIEIIPLIDVIFFLLATFVLFTLSLNAIQSVPVDLPKATPSAPPDPDDESVVLQVTDGGSAYWNRELIGFNEIAPRLSEYKNNHANARVLITGDDKAKYGAAVKALDEVRKAGITQVSIETTFRPSGR